MELDTIIKAKSEILRFNDEVELATATFIKGNSRLQVLTSCLASASTRSSSDVCSLLGRGWYSRPKPSSVAEEVGVEWKAVASGEGRLDTGGRTMEKDGDIRGEWSNDFLLAMMQLFQ